ncbi:MAG: WecB/TagA/CpsF family glycosyltransferase [Candidatus Gottesmanbacteria bacterium]|nr:WecB/TagA/CpsF family glycosyltransferase [Candidatus Gottesmanbacteria bacterium]
MDKYRKSFKEKRSGQIFNIMMHKYQILHVGVSPVNNSDVVQFIRAALTTNQKVYICVAAVHLTVECQHDNWLLDGVNRADLVVPDGMPLVWLLRLAGYKNAQRVYGPGLMKTLCKEATHHGWRVYLLGGRNGQSDELAHNLQRHYSSLRVVGARDTPVRPIPEKQNRKIIEEINKSRADIVFVGMGCPEQERWMMKNRNTLIPSVLIGVGAAFDFLSGRVRQAPAWMQHAGLEWLFRLSQEPQRLWKRYTITNIQFLFYLGKYIFRFAR